MNSKKTSAKQSNNKFILFSMLVILLILLFVVIRIFLLLLPGKIPLDEFISVDLSGYNTVGEAQIVFDYNSFIEQYGDKIKFKSESAKEQFMQDYPDAANLNPAGGWLTVAKVGLSQYTGLSNGDSVTLKSNSSDSHASDYFNYVAEYNDAQYVIDGLPELVEINLLDDMSINFTGCSPDISVTHAELAAQSDFLQNIDLVLSKTEHLAEGESIEISLSTLDGTDIYEYLATCGYKPTTVSHTVKALGEGHYITSTDEIPEDVMDQLKENSEELYTEYLSTKDGSNYRWTHDVNSMNYIGSLLLSSKDTSKTDTANSLYLVYEVSTYITCKPSANSRTTYKNNVIWYFASRYDNATLSNDDVCDIEPVKLTIDQTGEVGFAADEAGEISEIYYGFASYEDVIAQLVEPREATYDCENRLVAPEETENN